MTPCSPRSISANASSHVASRQVSPVRIIGVRSRSGSDSSCFSAVPFGQRKPPLKTSSLSPRTNAIWSSSRWSSNPQVASHNGQVRYSIRFAIPPG